MVGVSEASEQTAVSDAPLDERFGPGFTAVVLAGYAAALVVAPLVLYVEHGLWSAGMAAAATWYVLMGQLSEIGPHAWWEAARYYGGPRT